MSVPLHTYYILITSLFPVLYIVLYTLLYIVLYTVLFNKGYYDFKVARQVDLNYEKHSPPCFVNSNLQ